MSLYFVIPITGFVLANVSKDYLRNVSYKIGLGISKYCKKIPYWDRYVEPLLIKSAATVFIAMNSVLKGMASDNEVPLSTELQDFHNKVESELTENKL